MHFNSDDEFSSPDDASAFEFSCEDEEAWSTINAVNVLPATEVTSNEIFELTDHDHRDFANVCNVDAVAGVQTTVLPSLHGGTVEACLALVLADLR